MWSLEMKARNMRINSCGRKCQHIYISTSIFVTTREIPARNRRPAKRKKSLTKIRETLMAKNVKQLNKSTGRRPWRSETHPTNGPARAEPTISWKQSIEVSVQSTDFCLIEWTRLDCLEFPSRQDIVCHTSPCLPACFFPINLLSLDFD